MSTAATALVKVMQSFGPQVSPSLAEVHARLWKSYLSGLSEMDIIALIGVLRNGVMAPDWDRWLSKWQGILAQINRYGTNGQQIKAVFMFLQQGGLNGAAILKIFDDFNTGGLKAVHAEETIRILRSFQSGGLTARQITDVFQMLLNTLALPPADAKEGIDNLERRNLNPVQIRDVILALGNPGLAAARNPDKVTNLLKSVGSSSQSATDVHNFFTVAKAPLTVLQVIELSFGLDFQRLCELLAEVGGPAAVHAGLAACGNINSLRSVIAAMHDKDTSDTHRIARPAQVTFLNELQHVPNASLSLPNPAGGQPVQAANRVERALRFVKLATTAMEGGRVNGRSWTQILALPATFRAAGRVPLAPLATPGPLVRTVPGTTRTLRCPGERIVYFLRAHTLQFCSFRLADRTKDDITFWSGNAHSPATMQAEVQQMLTNYAAAVNDIMDDATPSPNGMSIQFAGDYEAGIIGSGNNYTLLHFMPITTYPNAVQINKHLLIPLGFLLAATNDL